MKLNYNAGQLTLNFIETLIWQTSISENLEYYFVLSYDFLNYVGQVILFGSDKSKITSHSF